MQLRLRTNSRQYYVYAGLACLALLSYVTYSDLLHQASEGSKLSRVSQLPQVPVLPVLPVAVEEPLVEVNEHLKLVTTQAAHLTTSAAHCSLSTMNRESWFGAVCSFKSLCFDPKTNEWIFYRAIPEIASPAHGVNLGKGTKFLPRVVEGQLPLPRYETRQDETWVIMEMNEVSSVQKLEDHLRDDLFAWWLLAQHATWSDTKTVIRPLDVSSTPQTDQMKSWYSAMPFADLITQRSLAKLDHPICINKGVAGLGSMIDHCHATNHDFHKQHNPLLGIAVESIPCATGRGPLFYHIREEMIAKLMQGDSEPRTSAGTPHQVLFAEASSDQLQVVEESIRSSFPQILIKRIVTSKLSPKELLELALETSIIVTYSTGPQTVLAHFLRPGAAVILLEKRSGRYTNFGLWNNLGYIRARWLRATDKLEHALKLELDKCESFM